jgi:hypothetical protein
MESLPPAVVRVEDVTAEVLGGASEQEVAAFHVAAFAAMQALEVPERIACLLMYGDGHDWREPRGGRPSLEPLGL